MFNHIDYLAESFVGERVSAVMSCVVDVVRGSIKHSKYAHMATNPLPDKRLFQESVGVPGKCTTLMNMIHAHSRLNT